MKKKSFITILLTVLMSMTGAKAFAYDIAVENADGVTIYYNYINDTKELEVTYKDVTYSSYYYSVVIPDEVNFMNRIRKVTRIGDSAFRSCGYLTSIIIPNSVTTIGDYAFKYCQRLASVTMPNNVTSIGDEAFYECNRLTSVTIPNSVTSIGDCAFDGCSSLTSITIPNSVTSIGDFAFSLCRGLTSVAIPNSVTSIGSSAFGGCSSLTSITIPNSVTTIGDQAFASCSSLTSITIPNSVTTIGVQAFDYCNSLTSVTIGNNVSIIGGSAFQRSDISTVISLIKNPFEIEGMFYDDYGYYRGTFSKNTFLNATLYVPVGTVDKYKSTKGWKDFLFIEEWDGSNNPSDDNNDPAEDSNKPSTSGVIAEKDWTGGFKGDYPMWAQFAEGQQGSITSDPNGVAITIGTQTGEYWQPQLLILQDGLTLKEGKTYVVKITAKFPCNGTLQINMGNWEGNDQYTTNVVATGNFQEVVIEFPDYEYNVDGNGFVRFQCGDFVGTTIVKKVEVVQLGDECGDEPGGEDLPTSGKCGVNVYYSYDKTTHSLTITGTGAMTDYNYGHDEAPWFSYANEIQKIEIESGITTIGNFAFYKCSNITAIDIPATVTSIGSSAFEECSSLTSLTLNEGLETIKGSAFESCTGLKNITLPSTINTIQMNAFKNCTGLTDVYCYAESIPDTDDAAFDGTPTEKATLHVPASAVEAYKGKWPWSTFKPIVALDDDSTISGKCGENVYYSYNSTTHTLTISGEGGFANSPWRSFCNDIQSVIIESGVTSIGNEVFRGCSSLTSITIPDGVTYIGCEVFINCVSLTSITIPNSVTRIANHAFERCGLTSITIPDNVTKIGYGTFWYCTSLTSITIPNSVTSIAAEAFLGCNGLKTVISEIEDPFAVNNDVFDGIPSNATLIVPIGKKSTYQSTAGWNQFTNIVEAGDDSTISGTCGENVYYSYNAGTHTLTISGQGEMHDYYPDDDSEAPWSSYRNDIQSVIIESGVTGIGTSAFGYCRNLTSVTIPNSVTTISGWAFIDCSSLSSVTIPNSVTSIKSRLGSGAFSGCSSLYEINLPNSLKSIDYHAFQGCSNLSYVVSEIENPFGIAGSVFDGIPSDAQLIVPIGTKAAYQATEGWNVFQDIVEAGGGIVEDDNGVGYMLDGESAVVSIGMSVKGEVKIEESIEVGGKTYQVTAIAEGAFQGNVEITSMEIPNSVETIGGSAFEGCTGLSFISIGEAIKEIASRAFAGILGMTSTRADGEGIDVYCYSEDVPHTAEDIFDGTPTEKSTLHVPAKAVEAYRAAWPWSDFKEIVPLTDTSLNANGIIFTVKDDGTLEVTGLETKTTTADIPSIIDMDGKKYQVTSIAERAFEGRNNINYFSIPFSVTSIGSFAFMDCGNDMTVNIADLESWCKMELGNEHSSPLSSAKKVLVYDVETDEIDIPEGVTSIGNYTFYQCHSITSLSIPATVASIGSSAFEDCTGLTSLTLSDGIESIGGSAFEGCSALESLTIPSTVNSISTNAFKNCKGITDVYCYAEAVPNTATDAFDGTPTEASTLHVPASAVEVYKAAWPWSDFKEIVAIEEGPDAIMGIRQSAEGNGDYYDLTGRKVQQLRKGLYIRNGKKVVIK